MHYRSVAHVLRENTGAVFIEFAFVLPVLVLLLTGIFDFGFAFRDYLLVTNAAREGARMAILPGYTDDDVTARVTDYLTKAGGLTTGTTDVVVSPPESPPGATYTVRRVTAHVDHTFAFFKMLGLKIGTVPLTAVSAMRVEVAAEAP